MYFQILTAAFCSKRQKTLLFQAQKPNKEREKKKLPSFFQGGVGGGSFYSNEEQRRKLRINNPFTKNQEENLKNSSN
ncbi:hypothetical protein [Adhaeribacter soli]|uniref:hypothetical protein n=1 Tax=Adhaeribacter soli TaxID=2607655 RepID=UPI00177E6DDE|nr:hypothetical protein [Adhaeribacter soli]